MPTVDVASIFSEMGLEAPAEHKGEVGPEHLVVENPASGQTLAVLPLCGPEDADAAVERAAACFGKLADMPGPKRGELVRRMGERLRECKEPLSQLVCLEMGKIIEEARGEVQEMIDICDYAMGLSRSLGGRTLFSERPGHRMFEQWHPLGPVLCISAFNFPVAVWSWNAALAIVCGDPVIWKPSLKTPLTAIATDALLRPILEEVGCGDAMQLVIGPDQGVATRLVADERIPLVSATGSCAMGRKVAPVVAARLARSLLELGGNNAIIVESSADLDMAALAILFGAAGTAGQRCTTTRRVFVERAVRDDLIQRLTRGYEQLLGRIGDPMDAETLVGPLIDAGAVEGFEQAMSRIREHGGKVLVGGAAVEGPGHFVQPTLVEVPDDGAFPPMDEETFAPILYVRCFEDGGLEAAIAAQNAVEQGLSSAIFTDSVRGMERFLGALGSDCGIANVNIGTSGAEIGGAFGGEKATGGGREAGSDSWKAYMRRQTCTVNGSDSMPLAQGIRWE
jgi:aldehyde dehydrogenase (NAD+)